MKKLHNSCKSTTCKIFILLFQYFCDCFCKTSTSESDLCSFYIALLVLYWLDNPNFIARLFRKRIISTELLSRRSNAEESPVANHRRLTYSLICTKQMGFLVTKKWMQQWDSELRKNKVVNDCDGDAIFFLNCRIASAAVVTTLDDKFLQIPWFGRKNSVRWISRDLFLRFFQLTHQLWEGGYTCVHANLFPFSRKRSTCCVFCLSCF